MRSKLYSRLSLFLQMGPERACALALVLLVGAGVPAVAQQTPTAADIEAQVARSQGYERARALADLVWRLRNDNPRRAIEAAHEALGLFALHPDPEARVRTLNEMAWAHMQLGQFDEAVERASQGRDLAERSNDARGRARAINNLGVVAQRRGLAPEAIEHFEQSLAIYREIGDPHDISNALNNLGFVHGTDLADYETGLQYHVEALSVRERLGDQDAVALSLNNIGIIYDRLGEHARALDYFTRSLALREQTGSVLRSAGTLSNIGDVYFELGDYDRAHEYHERSRTIRERIGERPGIANSLRNLGNIEAARGRPEPARTYLTQALAMSRESGDRTTEAITLLGLAALERGLGRGTAAATLARQALTIAGQTSQREVEQRALEELARAEEAAGRPAAALAAFKRFKTLEDQIFAEDRTRRLEVLERRYQAEKHQAENERLRARQELNVLQASRTRLERNAIAGAGVLALAIGFVLYRRRVDAARLASELSVTDALTGLRNRRYIDQTIDADVAAAIRRARSSPDTGLVFMLIDIDDFKSLNDAEGHRAGDGVLVTFAGLLRATCRASDTIARWGGEEFLILCRETSADEAAVLAERVRLAVRDHRFGTALRVTCSIGFAKFPDARTPAWEQAVARADAALYEAKRQGRNRWVDARDLDAAAPPTSAFDRPATANAE